MSREEHRRDVEGEERLHPHGLIEAQALKRRLVEDQAGPIPF